MRPIDYDELLRRMLRLEKSAFEDFNVAFRSLILEWCRGAGFSEFRARQETERCLFELAIMTVKRADEIRPGRLKHWVLMQTRNLVVLYWQMNDAIDAGETLVVSKRSPALKARRIRQLTARLDGSEPCYRRAAELIGVPIGWLRHQHLRVLARLRLLQENPGMQSRNV